MVQAAQFVSQYQWVCDLQVTRFFELKWWKMIPIEWHRPLLQLSTEEINQLPFHLSKYDWPQSLKHYSELCSGGTLTVHRSPPDWVQRRALVVDASIRKGMSPKKLHEVSRLAGIVELMCQKSGCQVVLDIGSGLGYLGQCLSRQTGLVVISIEKEKSRIASAHQRSKYFTVPPSQANSTVKHTYHVGKEQSTHVYGSKLKSVSGGKRSIEEKEEEKEEEEEVKGKKEEEEREEDEKKEEEKEEKEIPSPQCQDSASLQSMCIELDIGDDKQSREKIRKLLDKLQSQYDSSLKVCVVGLHCCGDLTPAVLKLFADQIHPALNSLTVVGCCYHKMTRSRSSDTNTEEFSLFPLSVQLRKILTLHHISFSVCAMRLAAQETKQRWRKQSMDEHTAHEKHVAFRGMLQAVHKGNYLPRKVLRGRHDTIEEYATSLSTQLNNPDLRYDLLHYHSTHSQFIPFIEPFTALQVCMQGVLESLVVVDRLMFLQEAGLTAECVAVFDEDISPRNIAILAQLN